MNIYIRKETVSDIDVISEITKAAFANLPISQHTEEFIIKALRRANALTISLVAEVGGKVFVEGVLQEYVLALPFDGNNACGTILFHEGFAAKG